MDERKKQALERLEEVMANLEEAWRDRDKLDLLINYQRLSNVKRYIEMDVK